MPAAAKNRSDGERRRHECESNPHGQCSTKTAKSRPGARPRNEIGRGPTCATHDGGELESVAGVAESCGGATTPDTGDALPEARQAHTAVSVRARTESVTAAALRDVPLGALRSEVNDDIVSVGNPERGF
jgi:hypothetical protein